MAAPGVDARLRHSGHRIKDDPGFGSMSQLPLMTVWLAVLEILPRNTRVPRPTRKRPNGMVTEADR